MSLTLRASGMPLAFACPGSLRAPELAIDEATEAAMLGTATHKALETLAEKGSVDWDALPSIAQRFGVSEKDLRILCAQATKLWTEIGATFTGATTELALGMDVGDASLTGHIDLVSVVGTVARAADWKTGRVDHNYAPQMRAYAALLFEDDRSLTEVTVTVLWIREGEIENYSFTRADAAAWVETLRAEVLDWDGVYPPGAPGPFCPRRHECAAVAAKGRSDVAALATVADASIDTMTPEQVVHLYEQASHVAELAKRAKDAIRLRVLRDGEVRTAGQVLTFTFENRREVDTAKAWPVLEAAGFGDAELAEVITISASAAEGIAAKRAGKGKGAEAKRQLAAALEAAGAITTNETKKLALRRA